MSEETGAPKEFVPIKSPEEAEQLLQEGTKGFVSVLIWSKNQRFTYKTHFTKYDKVNGRLFAWIPKDFDNQLLELELSESQTRECYFSVSLSWANIFFKARYIGRDVAGLVFGLPSQLFKVQRRKDLRLKITEGLKLAAELDDPAGSGQRLSKRLFDLSASGMSLLGEPFESAVFAQGLLLTNILINIEGRSITIPRAQVRHCKPLDFEGQKRLKIGILFNDIRAGDSQRIASFVFEESRKYFLKFV